MPALTNSFTILLLTDSDGFAGTERHILDLATALSDAHARVHIGCPQPSPIADRAAAKQIPVMAIPKRGGIDFHAIKKLRNWLVTGKVDIIHAHNGRTHFAAARAVALARRGACIATQHFLFPTRTRRRGLQAVTASFLHRYSNSHTAHQIAISDAVKEQMVARGDGDVSSISTIHNGMADVESHPPDYASQIRRSLNLAFDVPMVLCAARLQPEKDIAALVLAMRRVIVKCPVAQCFIAGEGPLQNELHAMIQQLNLQGSVHLLGFRNDVLSLTNACDLFVLPSPAEPFGLVVLEAMAFAKPVIATNAGGPSEIIVDGATGLLVPPSNPDYLATAILQFIDNPDHARRLGIAGRTRFVEKFTAARMATETLAVYQQVLAKTAVPAAHCGDAATWN